MRKYSYFALGLLLAFLYQQCTEDRIYNNLIVEKGSGSGVYAVGDQVRIEADTPAKGFGFFAWEGDVQFVDDPSQPIAGVHMPMQNVWLRAIYKELPTYQLTVEQGTGSGRYLAGTRVTVAAILPPGDWEFDRWEGDIQYLDNEEDKQTDAIMPERDVSIRALFKEVDLVSFNNDIMPIFQQHCSSCHGANNNKPYSNYDQIAAAATDIRISLETEYMPPNGMPQAQKDLIYLWITQGKRNN